MKKVLDIIKPYLSIILGTLIFLYYLNNLAGRGSILAIGIVALIVALTYIGLGVVNIFATNSIKGNAKRIFGFIEVSLYPLFLFVIFLITLINNHSHYGPAGWVINIISLIVSLGLAGLYVVTKIVPDKTLNKLATLFGGLFILVLLLNVLFSSSGNPIVLGSINVILVVTHIAYVLIMVDALRNLDEPKPRVKKEKPKKAPKAEEKKEEKPSEEPKQEVVDEDSETKEEASNSEEEKIDE